MQLSRKKIFIITAVIVLAMAAVALLSRGGGNSGNEDVKDVTTGKGEYYDPNSKQTVSNPQGKAPDTYGRDAAAPIYLGTASLLDYGVTSGQEQDMQFAIYQYFKSEGQKVKEVSVVVDSIAVEPYDSNNENTLGTINFDIVVDRKTKYKVKMNYFDLVSIQLYLYDATGATQLHDSGVISNQHL
ncbi:MAG TPA: hypothetical protein VFT16_01935 [Candidatus Saccharimonadales bacterium]|nr:hypothetical protein [Candidatus Saccharimonadales bacterium]